jgi:transcriptional regulator with PAS, ATPase and Fis domain
MDIYEAVNSGNFRQDLLYRINTLEIHVPPLRERGRDIILLATHFIEKFSHKYKKDIHSLSLEAKAKIMNYAWPGNVRELQNVMERSVILSSDKILKAGSISLQTNEKKKESENLNLNEIEQEAIEKALKRSDGNMNKAAGLLGITRYALYRKIKKE